MNVVRLVLGFVVTVALIVTQPVLSAVSPKVASDPDAVYTVRVERGKSDRVKFRLVGGDSVIEADQLDFVVTKKGLAIRPVSGALASGTAGKLTFEQFELFLPTDGSEPFMSGAVPK